MDTPSEPTKLTDYHYNCVGPGWAALLTALDYELRQVCPEYQILQIKEKFGGLRYYISGNTPAHNLTERYEALSQVICEQCGKAGECYSGRNRETPGGWVRTLCDPCREEFWTNRKTFSERVKEINAD